MRPDLLRGGLRAVRPDLLRGGLRAARPDLLRGGLRATRPDLLQDCNVYEILNCYDVICTCYVECLYVTIFL